MTLLLEPLAVLPAVAIFGVGHVGLELARILARHNLALHLVDSRPEQLSDEVLAVLGDAVARIHTHHVPVLPELVLAELPVGTHVLVMTHDHAEDAALIDAALRTSHLGSIGLIGSSAKWSRFRAKLADEGHDEQTIARVTTPIGIADLAGKEPATIAVSVAASPCCRSSSERPSAARRAVPEPDPAPAVSDDALPGHVPGHPRQSFRRWDAARRGRRRRARAGRGDPRAWRLRRAFVVPIRTRSSSTSPTAWSSPGSSTPMCTSPRSA